MKTNMHIADRIARVALGIIIGILFLADIINGVFAGILGVIALVSVVTGLIGFCPAYTILFKKK